MLKHIIPALLMILLVAIPVKAETWQIDKTHSHVGFSVRHLVISKTKGEFKDYDAKIDFNHQDIESSSVEVTIQVKSIDTDNKNRDSHLRTSDFFDVDKYPLMSFKSEKTVKSTDGMFKIIGDLTIKDVTREVVLEGELHGVVKGPMGKTRAGFSVTTKINRQDYNVSWSNKLQDGSLIVGDDIEIFLEIELIKAS